ncbi:thioesterase domain-containing protein [Kitasatospora aureofaciens]|uniref:thioesterase domain-containing protein n=1 Tax=Kitasatospora aureofaciens TaxID=1894 RepID=UPI0033ED9B13
MTNAQLTTLARGKGDTVVVLIHPASGSLTGLRRFAAQWPTGQTILGIEATGPGAPGGCSVEQIADHYLDLLPATLDQSAVIFGGWSLGGAVAVEMCRRHLARGGRVPAIWLFDSASPDVLASFEYDVSDILRLLFDLNAQAGPRGRAWQITEELLSEAATVLSTEFHAMFGDVAPDDLRSHFNTYIWHVASACAPWAPTGPALDVEAVLVRARDEGRWAQCSEDLGWAPSFSRPVSVVWVPGSHNSLFDAPRVPGVIKAISAATTS